MHTEPKQHKTVFALVIFSVVFYCAYFAVYTCIRHYKFATTVFDLGVYNQVFWSIVHTGKFLSTLDTGVSGTFVAHNLLSTHFSLIYYLLAPVYWFYQKPETLLVLQSFLLGLPGLLIYFLARQKTKNEFLALAFCLSYLLYVPLHNINLFDFHEVACAPFLILSTLYCLENKKYQWFCLFFLLSLFIKEDVALSGIGIGIYILLIKRQRWFGIVVALFSIAYFVATIKFFMPFFGSPADFSSRYSQLILPGHHGYAAILYTMVTKPIYVLKAIFWNKDKILYWFKIFTPLLWLPLCNNIGTIILILPSFLVNLLSNYQPQYDIHDQYTGILIPFLYFTAILSTQRIYKTKIKKLLAILLIVVGIIPLGRQLMMLIDNHGQKFIISPHDRVVRDIINEVPKDASVSSVNYHGAHFSSRSVAYMLPKGIGYVDYIMLDLKHIGGNVNTYFMVPTDKKQSLQVLYTAFKNNYGVVDFQDGCVLLKYNYSTKRNVDVLNFVKQGCDKVCSNQKKQ